MLVAQIYNLMNEVTDEILGNSSLLQEDLSNVVDLGKTIFDNTNVDNYVKTLLDRIGKVVFVNRVYSGAVPSVVMDAWEYGSVLEKIQADIPEAEENESWNLQDGSSYDPNVFKKMSVSVKFYNSKVTFEVPVSVTDIQVKESFTSATQLNAFLSMIYNAVDKSMTIKIDALVMRTINTVIAETLHDEFPSGNYGSSSGTKAINLLYLYNQRFGTDLTASDCLTNSEFIRFASMTMGVYMDRLKLISTLFNVEGKERFTPSDMLHIVMLSDFDKACDAYLYSDTFHESYAKLPAHETVPYWQASGKTYSFSDISKINLKTANNNTVTASGILCIMFDRDCLGVSNLSRRTTTNYNPKGEFTNSWFKFDCSYFADLSENAIVFYVA